ncbi:unnamed protein product [Thelazia callipaeda]|uniref:Choline O-acetyltransferase n=1 Tax=Thelazia callipaeda TaxID=103827 RepID=A0A0N5D1X6_THECL|nr:unnamed protein product [Thelazia callipaeda]
MWYILKKPIPKPPLPSLEHTLKRYQEYASVVARNDPDKLLYTKKAISEFLQYGTSIQKKLEKIANEEDNWINQFWLPEMYLKVRLPLPLNSSPAYIFPQQNFNDINEQISYASWLICGFCNYKDLIDRKLITREISTGRHKVFMCMEQYDRILRCYREPSSPIDIQHYKPNEINAENSDWDEHILAMCNNKTFIVLTRLSGTLLSQAQIAKQLEKVVEMSKIQNDTNLIPIAGGSVGDRDDAAKFWNIMNEVEQNQESLKWIRSASFGICIDIHNKTKWSRNYERNLAHRGMHMLHGFGSKGMGLNRWYDITVQIVVSSNGTNGLCIEHSVAEGIVIINMAEYALQFVKRNSGLKLSDDTVHDITPMQLHLANDLNLQVLIFNGFGKEFIKSCNISPDGFVQLTMQLAYYRQYGHLVSTYESASIRRFRSGRVDNIRAATPEALRWVQAMLDESKTRVLLSILASSFISFKIIHLEAKTELEVLFSSDILVSMLQEEKWELFTQAVKKQAEVTLENITGYGIDNHLCALQLLATDDVKQGLLPKMPKIFLDPIWTETMRFPLSTSQVTTSTSIKDTYLCYGPVVKDGYGCSYNIQPNSIIFAPSSFKSCPVTNAGKFKQSLVDSLNEIQAMITH